MTAESHSFHYDAEVRADRRGGLGVFRSILAGWTDLAQALAAWRLWAMLGWHDIRQRYRRSKLGPFWITFSMAIFIVLLGVIYSKIFNMDIALYLPYVAMGLIAWRFISGVTTEACGSFIENAAVIKQLRLPYSIYVMRTVWRDFVIFLHVVVLIVPIAIFFDVDVGLTTLLVIPGILLVFVNQVWVAIVVSILSTRYRDMPQLVQTVVQIAMFATPIMWPVSALGGAEYIANVNPLHHLVELVRAPLLGAAPPLLSWAVVIGICVFGFVLAGWLLNRAAPRIVYWL